MVISKKKIDSLREEIAAAIGDVSSFDQMSPADKEQIAGSLLGLTKILSKGVDSSMFSIVSTAFDGMKPALSYAHEMEGLATKDRVTGLLNRTGIESLGQARVEYARRNDHTVGVFFLDLNRFKPINDTLGHDEGDKALDFVGQKLKEVLRASDLISRYGGDEFVIVVMNDDPNHKFEAEKDKLMELFDGNVIFDGSDGRGYEIGTALGFTKVAEGEDMPAAIKRADKIMYDHKKESEHTRTSASDMHETNGQVPSID